MLIYKHKIKNDNLNFQHPNNLRICSQYVLSDDLIKKLKIGLRCLNDPWILSKLKPY